MRTFKCYDCGHTWQLPYGEGGVGAELSCPECESRNIHRADDERGGRGRGGGGLGRRRMGRGRGRRQRSLS
jgi:DNA-directed RNA polymerase subunit RPC12/RpoP